MSKQDETVNVNAASELTSIQITINFGKPQQNVAPQPKPDGSQAPMGAFIRQVCLEAGDNPTKKIRTSFIPDDLTQNASTQIADPDPGELAKWKKLLGDPQNIDVDAGVSIMRMNEEGGTATWLPENANQDPIIHRFKQKTEEEPGGATIGDFIRCWLDKGQTAAAASNCWSRL
jgi:hypothetical protein